MSQTITLATVGSHSFRSVRTGIHPGNLFVALPSSCPPLITSCWGVQQNRRMAKNKGVPNKHLHARVAFLQQAAKHLALLSLPGNATVNYGNQDSDRAAAEPPPRVPNTDSSRGNEDRTPCFATSSGDTTSETSLRRTHTHGGLARQLSSHSVQVARRSQIRLEKDVKRAMCRRCNMPLIEGETSKQAIENLSRGGRKPHADVSVTECCACGAAKRLPIGATRQLRKSKRPTQKAPG